MKEGQVLLIMDEVLQMLRLLDYEAKFLKDNGLKPLSEGYFAI